MATQVFNSEQDAIDHANQPEFAVLCLNQWGLSRAHAVEVAKRVLSQDGELSASVSLNEEKPGHLAKGAGLSRFKVCQTKGVLHVKQRTNSPKSSRTASTARLVRRRARGGSLLLARARNTKL